MPLTMRAYRDADDYWRLRAFVRDVFPLDGARHTGWDVVRFDYWRWHGVENIDHFILPDSVVLWQVDGDRIVGAIHPEARGEVWLEVHPAYRTPDLEMEMIGIAEEKLSLTGPSDRRTLRVWANERDRLRVQLLTESGYARCNWHECQRRRSLSLPIPDPPLPCGYVVRSLGDADENPARSWLSWRAFHPDAPDDEYEGRDWYANIQRAPLYRRDLDLVAVAPDGGLASFATAWFDDANRIGVFEPVGTSPEHQRRGLARAILAEGLRRLKRLGATTAYVGSGSAAAHALYASAGLTEYDVLQPWERVL